jgi:hypothetical protein
MRKILLGLMAAAAIAAPIAATTAAHAATIIPTGHAIFHATQPSGGGGNWVHTFDVNVGADGGFTGQNTIVGMDAGQMTTVNETVSGKITDNNNDGIDEITVTGVRPSGLYTFSWSVKDAPMDGVADSMTEGTTSYVTAQDWTGGALPITFTPPVFDAAPQPVVATDNHGECVSGFAHAGYKGGALAAIAKDKTKVGAYGSATCKV